MIQIPLFLVSFLLLFFSRSEIDFTNQVLSQQPKWNSPEWCDTIKSPTTFTSEFIQNGKRNYFHQCSVCHGPNGKGDGESGFGLDVPPGDLTDAYTTNESDGSIFYKISVGRDPMPEFESKLSQTERWQLVSWIRQMQKNQVAKLKNKKK